MPQKMLFNYETTYRTDFRDGKLESSVQTIFIPKVKKPRNEPIPLKDIQAMFPLRDPHIPFHLFHQPNPIIRTSPWVVQKRYVSGECLFHLYSLLAGPANTLACKMTLGSLKEKS